MVRHYACKGWGLVGEISGPTHGDLQRATRALGGDGYASHFPEEAVEIAVYRPGVASYQREGGRWFGVSAEHGIFPLGGGAELEGLTTLASALSASPLPPPAPAR